MKKTMESKSKLLKNKLIMALGVNQNEEGMSYDDVVRLACEHLEQIKFN